MTDNDNWLPEGWGFYDPTDNERASAPGAAEAREAIHQAAEKRRAAWGPGLAAIRKARTMTQTQLAAQLGISQSDVSRTERQADLLASTFTRYIEAMGGRVVVSIQFPDAAPMNLELHELAAATRSGSDDPTEEPQKDQLTEVNITLDPGLGKRQGRTLKGHVVSTETIKVENPNGIYIEVKAPRTGKWVHSDKGNTRSGQEGKDIG
jgi:transcriptional regulator with XRE-family HTH domain